MLNILTFDEFKKVMDGVVKEWQFQDDLYMAVKKVDKSSDYIRDVPTIGTTIMLLNRIFKDESEYPLIDYWVYELDCGKRWKEGDVTENDGTDIPLKTVSDLYDELVRQYANRNGE